MSEFHAALVPKLSQKKVLNFAGYKPRIFNAVFGKIISIDLLKCVKSISVNNMNSSAVGVMI